MPVVHMNPPSFAGQVDPLKLARVLWPDDHFYDKQREIVYSVLGDESAMPADETSVPAGNKLGKDWVAGRIVTLFALTRHPFKVVTTSATQEHLDVLWGEIKHAIRTSAVPLLIGEGGPLYLMDQGIRRIINGERCPNSYVKAMVANDDSMEAMGGHHVAPVSPGRGFTCCGLRVETTMPRTLLVVDEASALKDGYIEKTNPWTNRVLLIGNCYECQNHFRWGVEGRPGTEDRGGDRWSKDGRRCYRRVIRICAEDSPNVKLGLAQKVAGIEPTNELILPGVKTYADYAKDREELDEAEQCVKLDARWYRGKGIMLFPDGWLDRAEGIAAGWHRQRRAEGVGIDPAEGGDKTAMCAVDRFGVIELVSRKTPDTNDVVGEAIAFLLKHGCPPESVVFDRGGGGKQHADRMRSKGYEVRSVGFGETVMLEPRRGMVMIEEKIETREERYSYVNLRAKMYYDAAELLDPSLNPDGFGIPREYAELRRQLAPLPRWTNEDGRRWLPPKHRKPGAANTKVKTIEELIGCSPDEADAFVLAVHAMLHESHVATADAI